MSSQVLFICTGNFYRSRFAEAVFNHYAVERNLEWRAISRGLATHLVAGCGPVSLHALEALSSLKIDVTTMAKVNPVQLSGEDLASAKKVIALKETEHRPMLESQFPDWDGPVDYWHVHDLDMASPEVALGEVKSLVCALVDELDTVASGESPG